MAKRIVKVFLRIEQKVSREGGQRFALTRWFNEKKIRDIFTLGPHN